ncbi:hypothetical protein SADUNF_Sadunf11G0093000 [Salix dunnii]|uniref:Bulb-type lectin domain-containing protein n=1 Tax=Salix dunnii TaxID=1413687 RepID=A0A835MPE2_9ROSI|nr:hypothetical protein SADUNF_Sadunf11G0093000 [Salix dunnii]
MKFLIGPGKSKNRYVEIWYGNIPVMTIVWVANRETPFNDSSGVLRLTDLGILVILNLNGTIIWSSNSPRSASNPSAQLLDSGNLVVKEGDNMENTLWQSFEHPTDTILPGMKLGMNRITGIKWSMTSWNSPDDPSRDNFSCIFIPYGYPELAVTQGSKIKYRPGLCDGLWFSGIPNLKQNPIIFKVLWCEYLNGFRSCSPAITKERPGYEVEESRGAAVEEEICTVGEES